MPETFRKGMRVRYIPRHAHGDPNHKDCQDGVVSSTNPHWVFVKYDNLMCIMTTGDEPYTAAATSRDDLIPLGNCENCPRCNALLRAPKYYDPLKKGCPVCGWGTDAKRKDRHEQ